MDIQSTLEAIGGGVDFAHSLIPPERLPSVTKVAMVAVPAGFVLAFWGSRLLRTLYVLAFMCAGGAVGVRLADNAQLDKLIGLVVGGGAAALVGHLCYRWWVGTTTGIVAVLAVAALTAPQIKGMVQGYNDSRVGVGTAEYVMGSPEQTLPAPAEQAWDYLKGFKSYLLTQHSGSVYQTGALLVLLWLLAVFIGVLFPRFVTVLGTASVGVLVLTLAAMAFLRGQWPAAWSFILDNRSWFLGAVGVMLLLAISFQARRRRAVVPVVPSAPVAEKAA